MPARFPPRKRGLGEIFGEWEHRIRRLEVTKIPPTAGTSVYSETYSLGDAADWASDFSGSAPTQEDQIGMHGGASAPQGWIVWATLVFTIAITDPPMGEALRWTAGVGEGVGAQHSEVLFDGTQTFGALVVAPSGWANAHPLAISLFAETAYGSEFSPMSLTISAVGIELPVEGFPTGIE